MSKKLVPAIRFKEFTNDWFQHTVENIGKLHTGKLDTHQALNYGKYNFYTSGLNVYKIDSWLIDDEAVIIPGSGASIGVVHYYKGKFNLNQRTFALITNINTMFTFYSFVRNFKTSISKLPLVGAIPNILRNDILKEIIYVPCTQEQNKISNVFNYLDVSISLLKRKLEKLENIKNTLLNKMFANEKNLKPDIRFKEFTNDWFQDKVENLILQRIKSSLLISETIKFGNFPVYSSTGFFGYTNQKYIDSNFIIMSVDGSVGTMKIIPKNSWFISTNNAFIPKNINAIYFLYYILNNIDFNKYIVGTTIKHLYYENFKSVKIYQTDIEEQIKISKLFKNLDANLSLLKRKIEKMENIKQTLLNKMFVQ
ncbi:restriction endonuclease subunit S [Mycoplasma zalophi]|uniref:restriction endonuclease subunit S n=1 Tax=Mycoplasma zalophi TaxID=191287 RepID=UPI001C10F28C|nr:restriction endonuclease subunit S [Mycoplasma zalophi]MBU4691241.1 restriction endonuclease subunit S [Mycoplasma zalophi]